MFFLIALFAITANASAQLKIKNNGEVTIHAQTQDWWPALRVYVPTKSSCSYNLWNYYYNKDVFFVCGEGYLWTMKGGYFGSDITLKQNITPIEGVLGKVMSLNGVRFQYKDENKEKNDMELMNEEDFRLGFIAQEVEKIFPEVVKDMPDGTKAMSYTDLIPVLTEAIKEQQVQIEQLQRRLDACCKTSSENTLPTNNSPLERDYETKDVENQQKSSIVTGSIENAKLFQNAPNPFSMNTEVYFEIPQSSTSAQLLIHDMQGVEIKSYMITTKGTGTIIIQGSELLAGMYMYTLLVNNAIVDTKKMILTR
ncbi:MAG: tail fiber domain-containing protein [Bacteroidales bacterium]|nr:tail fiber domain-containing protein [Bacteroidales bacterium]